MNPRDAERIFLRGIIDVAEPSALLLIQYITLDVISVAIVIVRNCVTTAPEDRFRGPPAVLAPTTQTAAMPNGVAIFRLETQVIHRFPVFFSPYLSI